MTNYHMATTATYHKRKLYIPKDVERKLGLSDGDQAEISVIDDKSFSVSVRRKKPTPEERIVNRIIRNPLSVKLGKKRLRRKDYYENNS